MSMNVQKRRGGPAVLPVTTDDANSGKTLSNRRKKRPPKPNDNMWGLGKLLLLILGIGLVVVFVQEKGLHLQHGRHHFNRLIHKIKTGRFLEANTQSLLPYEKFPSLHWPLKNSHMVALYFAAGWCPESTPVTTKIDDILGDILLPPPQDPNPPDLPQRHGLSLVYVSSDRDAEELARSTQKNWFAIPFGSSERTELKQHFYTCAKKEMNELHIEKRKHEIPTLIILSGETHEVLTYQGVKDINEHGAQAVDHWMELNKLSSALESKYGKEREQEAAAE